MKVSIAKHVEWEEEGTLQPLVLKHRIHYTNIQRGGKRTLERYSMAKVSEEALYNKCIMGI